MSERGGCPQCAPASASLPLLDYSNTEEEHCPCLACDEAGSRGEWGMNRTPDVALCGAGTGRRGADAGGFSEPGREA